MEDKICSSCEKKLTGDFNQKLKDELQDSSINPDNLCMDCIRKKVEKGEL